IDDSEAARDHIKRVLSDSPVLYRTLTATNGLDGFVSLLSSRVDLVLCNVNMPVTDGFKFLALKSTRPDLVHVPVIMLTATDDVNQKVRALESGATDYLTKPFHASELLASVRVHLQLLSYQRELRRKNAELVALSNTGAHRGPADRRGVRDAATVALVRAARPGGRLGAVIVDAGHSPRVNDSCGHGIAEGVLEGVADVLRRGSRRGDVAARCGVEGLRW